MFDVYLIKKSTYLTVLSLLIASSFSAQKPSIDALANSVMNLKVFDNMQNRHLAIVDSFSNVKGVQAHFYYIDTLINKSKRAGDQQMEGISWMSKGNLFLGTGNNFNSIESFMKAITIFEKGQYHSGLCNATTNIGNTYFYMGEYEKALTYYKTAISHCKKIPQSNIHLNAKLANLYNNLGSVYCSKNDIVYGKTYFSMARAIWTKTNDSLSLAYVSNNFGQIFMDAKQFDSAEVYYKRALNIKLIKGDLSDKADGYKSMAALYSNMKDFKRSLENVKMSLTYLDTNIYSRPLSHCYAILNGIYHEMKDYKNELRYFKLYSMVNDSANSREKISSITKMEMQFEFSKIHLADSIKSGEEIKLKDAKISEKKQQSYFLIFILILTVVALSLIYSRFKLTKRQKIIIEAKNKEITDSINYARKIQHSSLPSEKYIQKELGRLKD